LRLLPPGTSETIVVQEFRFPWTSFGNLFQGESFYTSCIFLLHQGLNRYEISYSALSKMSPNLIISGVLILVAPPIYGI